MFGVKFVYLVILFGVVILFVSIMIWGKKFIFWIVGRVILKYILKNILYVIDIVIWIEIILK